MVRSRSLVDVLSHDTELIVDMHRVFGNRGTALTAALRSNNGITAIDIDADEVPRTEMMDYLASFVQVMEALEGKESIEEIIFRGLRFGAEYAEAATRLLRTLTRLRSLKFFYCGFGLEGARVVSSGIRNSPFSLGSFQLFCCLDGDGTVGPTRNDAIATVLVEGVLKDGHNNSLSRLRLFGNHLGDSAAAAIVRRLAQCQVPIEWISLDTNHVLGPETVQALAELVSTTSTLVEVRVGGNFGDDSDSEEDTWIHPSIVNAANAIVREGLRHNFELEAFSIDHRALDQEVQGYLQRNRRGRAVLESENRDDWVRFLIDYKDDVITTTHYLRQRPDWLI